MANNVEKFLIDFVFKDKKAVGDLKKIVALQDKIAKGSERAAKAEKSRARAEQQARKQKNQSAKAENALINSRIRLETKLQNLGMKNVPENRIRGFEKQAAAAKSVDELRKLSAQIDQVANKYQRLGRVQATLNKFRTSKSFKSLEAMDAGRATEYYAEAQKSLNRQTRQGRIEFDNINAEMKQHERRLRRNRAETINLRTAQKGLTDSTRNMIRAYASVFALFQGTTAINRVGQDFEGMRAAMLASSGGAEAAADDLAFVRSEAVRLGLDLRDATDNFVKFQFAAKDVMSQADTRALFTGFSEFATALQLNPQRYEKSLTALQQIMNKSQLMAEEVNYSLAV